ncbi:MULTISPECIES: type II toxin-antitoxin system RelE/ParE family toxin [Nocardia]|uniref:type II toxin-antitoxin system RelE/ParE family toxin n=1 Tax=Nocardia TaxID=1817 RepID=UPI0024585948|nr:MULTISPECIES: type II toxin-antitoxin system RelE/ParE family toxin [Nocardia]
MESLYSIEIEPEVRAWLESLPAKHFLKVEAYVALLAERATTLSEPFSRYLGEGVRELRPTLDGAATRITYWFRSDRTIVLLTTFRKTKDREDAEVKRAIEMRRICEDEHGPAHDEFLRTIEKGEL